MLEQPNKPMQRKDVPKDLHEQAILDLAKYANAKTTPPELREEAMRNIAEQFPRVEGPDEVE